MGGNGRVMSVGAAYLRGPELSAALLATYQAGYAAGFRQGFEAGCSGKVRQSRAEALATQGRRGNGTIYRCRACRSWHTSGMDDAAGAALTRKMRDGR